MPATAADSGRLTAHGPLRQRTKACRRPRKAAPPAHESLPAGRAWPAPPAHESLPAGRAWPAPPAQESLPADRAWPAPPAHESLPADRAWSAPPAHESLPAAAHGPLHRRMKACRLTAHGPLRQRMKACRLAAHGPLHRRTKACRLAARCAYRPHAVRQYRYALPRLPLRSIAPSQESTLTVHCAVFGDRRAQAASSAVVNGSVRASGNSRR